MNKITSFYQRFTKGLQSMQFLPLLASRLVLAYGFYGTAKTKWSDIHAVAEWFGSMGIPAPLLNAYLAAGAEALGVVLLILGLGTRIIVIPLIIVMIVAIKTVHWVNGFDAGNNGFEIPLYYAIMLLTLFVFGSGKISLDYLIDRKLKKK